MKKIYFDNYGKLTVEGAMLYPKAINLDTAIREERIYMEENGRLTTVGIALYAEAMKLKVLHLLPHSLRNSINEYESNYESVMLAYQFIKEENLPSAPYWQLLFELDEWLKNILANRLQQNQLLERIQTKVKRRNGNFEELTTAQMMSATKPMEVIQPTNNQLYIDDLFLEFSHPISSASRFYIVNEQEKEMASFMIPQKSMSYSFHLHPSKFPTGLYYGLLDVNDAPKAWRFYIATREDAINLWQQIV